jgi:hypothetical protein
MLPTFFLALTICPPNADCVEGSWVLAYGPSSANIFETRAKCEGAIENSRAYDVLKGREPEPRKCVRYAPKPAGE